jgi:hypothetical protein
VLEHISLPNELSSGRMLLLAIHRPQNAVRFSR